MRTCMLQSVLLTLIANFPELISCGSNYEKKYYVIKHNQPLDNTFGYTEVSSNVTLYSVRADSIDYQCWIPLVEDEKETIGNFDVDGKQKEVEKREAIAVIKDFNRKYRDLNVYRRNGYWSYQIRFDYDIRQYHQTDNFGPSGAIGAPTADFKLAAWTDEESDIGIFGKPSYLITDAKDPYRSESDFEMITSEDGTKYVTQRIGNGEICDLTGLPRSVTIKYLCNDKVHVPIISNVNEWKTCEYSIELESDYFCNHNMWTLPKELISNSVDCYPDIFQPMLTQVLDLQKISLEPLIGGVFLGREKKNKNKFSLLLTKDYKIKDEASESDEENSSNYRRLLMDISMGFQNLIRNLRLPRGSVLTPMKWNDSFKLITELYDIDRSYVGNIQLEQDENGFIVSFFTEDSVPESSNFIEVGAGDS